MLHRIPSLGNAVLEKLCNGPEAFSPDCKWIMGEAPEIRNYYIAAGMKTVGPVSVKSGQHLTRFPKFFDVDDAFFFSRSGYPLPVALAERRRN